MEQEETADQLVIKWRRTLEGQKVRFDMLMRHLTEEKTDEELEEEWWRSIR